MKFSLQNKKIQSVFSLIFAAVMFMSYSDDPPNGRSGAPGEGLCTDCHGNGNPGGFDGGISVTGFPSTITPGTVYPLTVTVSNPNGLAVKAGFQFTILNASNQKFGEFSAPSSNAAIATGSRDYVEHRPAINFDVNDLATWTVNWKAPATGSAQLIKLYAAGNIANGANGDVGDWIVTSQASGTFTPAPDPLTVVVTGTNVNCFGNNTGTATATPAGGTSPYNYIWSNGASTSTISNLSAGTYNVTVSDNAAQTVTGSYTVTQPSAALDVEIDASSTTIDCNNISVTLTTNASGGSSPYNYSWSTGANTPGITVFNGGTYSVTITDSKGCQSTDNILIDQIQPPAITIQPVADLCQFDNSVTLSAQPAGGIFGGPGVSGNLFTPGIAGPGNHTITYSFSENGCTYTESIQIQVIAQPAVNILNQTTYCVNGSTVTLEASIQGGFWSGTGVTGNQFSPSAAGTGDHEITYTLSSGGCISEASVIFTVIPAPVIDLPTIDDLCTSDENIDLTGSPAGGVWSGTGVVNNTFDPGISGAGTFTLTYTVTNLQGCVASSTVSVTVNPCGCDDPATANAGLDQSVCTFDQIQLIGSVSSSPSWTTTGDGNFTNPGQASTFYIWGPNDKLNKTVTLTLTAGDPDGNGPCTSFSDQMVVTYNGIDAQINTVPALCTTDTAIILTANVTGGIWAGDGVTGNTFDPAVAGIGSHTIFYSVQNEFGCDGFDTLEIEVLNCNCPMAAHAVITPSGCEGQSIGAVDIVFDVEGSEPYEFIWSNGSTDNSIDSLSAGNYSVTITDAIGCEIVINATVPDSEVDFFVNLITANCEDILCIENVSGGGPYIFAWSNGATTQCINVEGDGPGQYPVTVTNAAGCTKEIIFNYTPLADIILTIDSITTVTPDAAGIIDITVSGGFPGYTFVWNKNGTFYSSEEDLDSLTAGTYTLTVTDSSGCSTEFGPYIITATISNKDLTLQNLVRIYPNPAREYFTLECPTGFVMSEDLTIISMNGDKYIVKSDLAGNGKYNINISSLQSGVYMVQLNDKNNSAIKKLVVVK